MARLRSSLASTISPLGLEPPNLRDARCDHSADGPLTTRTLKYKFIPLQAIGRVIPHHQHASYVISFVRFLSVTLGIEKYAEDRRSKCSRPLLEPSQSGSSDGLSLASADGNLHVHSALGSRLRKSLTRHHPQESL
ncbi:hypothetical protein PV11_02087 [Exophiala sideris]|uniref:Uncharacterized protein n=1 Tax=Exophiala sideris TaxID=1016849 RepID=A0A0D1XEL5_9EURO|nr:hypothetical protein PV11_02087 [Exophiala sideris]